MLWRFEDDSLHGFATATPVVEGTCLVVAPITDQRDTLFPEEHKALEPMVESRQFGYSSGRHAAHLAQAELGLIPASIGRNERVPIWPGSCVGSITHSPTLAGAAASNTLSGIGIDLEEWGRVEDKLHRMLFTDNESNILSALPKEAATVMFSAKEAGYKAVYPTGQQFIGFKEAEIHLEWACQRFEIAYLGDHEPNKALNSGYGFWQVHADHVLTVFFIE